jgi:hypothetical protein
MLILLTLLGGSICPALASADAGTKVVRYRGYGIRVPAAWPVYNLSADPTVCVRFNRHAVYLGRPGSEQRCPAHAVGRTEAILVEPMAGHTASAGGVAGAGSAVPMPMDQGAQPPAGSMARQTIARRGLIVTATWARDPGVVRQALGVRSIGALTAATASAPRVAVPPPVVPAGPGAVYTGLGFDACSAPTPAQLSAWGSSPYHATGIYIGGTNMGCSQPNLTAAWVSEESAAGWHLIPTYVGLQAPTNSCGCSPMNPSQASAQGVAAANDAITQAQSLGIGAGNPIYFDLEAYPTGGTNTAAVLAFLGAWTAQLHAGGYQSGVYSSADSGIQDLAAQFGTGFDEPDDIWIADWNGEQTTSDSVVPTADWAAHERLHQYSGGQNATYGRVTINIDGDYLDGSTAAAGTAGLTAAPSPELTVSPAANGAINLYASWTGVSDVAAWQVLAGQSPAAMTPLAGATKPGAQMAIAVQSAFPYFGVQALGSADQVLATTPAVATPAHIAIYGHTVFSPARGLGGLPAGCFTGTSCHITTTMSTGRTVIATTGREFIPASGGGLLYFKLSPAGRAILAHAPGRRIPVKVTVHEASGTTATSTLKLVQFVSTGRGPSRSAGPASAMRIVGLTDFVSSGWDGGILAGCAAAAPCQVITTITVGRTTIARTGSESLGANQLGYLSFKLTPQGHAMLAHSVGNHLGAHVTIAGDGAVATANIALVKFG